MAYSSSVFITSEFATNVLKRQTHPMVAQGVELSSLDKKTVGRGGDESKTNGARENDYVAPCSGNDHPGCVGGGALWVQDVPGLTLTFGHVRCSGLQGTR